MIRVMVLSTLLSLLFATLAPLSANPRLAPVRNWRVCPLATAAGSHPESLTYIATQSANWTPSETDGDWIAFKIRSDKHYLLTFSWGVDKAGSSVTLESSADSTDGRSGQWAVQSSLKPSGRLDKFEIDSSAAEWWRLKFNFKQPENGKVPPVTDIAIYSLDTSGPKDYWLIIGASIQAQSINQQVFHDMVKTRYPGYDPVIFNLAVGGWKSDDLVKALPGFLKNHPYASYIGIHIGGNNVSAHRPYPGGAKELQQDLVTIIDMIKKSGKTPILSRLSYRAYKGKNEVPPEDNGSGPYVTNIYDPLISKYCPDFIDPTTGLCVVDGYSWFKTHQEELSPDGVHVNEKGATSWNHLWAEGAGGVIYGD
jgi:lysophospholipase L1-like esterase